MIQHPLSAAFPAMSQLELSDLTNDIRAHGQRQAIVILSGMVLDGWHRFQACETLHLEPITADLPEGVDPVAYVQSLNMHRRHLTGSQRAMAVVTCNEWAHPGNQPDPAPGAELATTSQMAQVAEVSPRTIEQAKVAHSAGVGSAVRDGKISVKRAEEISKLPEAERKAAMDAPRVKEPKLVRVKVLQSIIGVHEDEIYELTEALGQSNARVAELEGINAKLDREVSRQRKIITRLEAEQHSSKGIAINNEGGTR